MIGYNYFWCSVRSFRILLLGSPINLPSLLSPARETDRPQVCTTHVRDSYEMILLCIVIDCDVAMNAAVYATYTRRDKKITPVERVSRGGTDIELVVRQSPRDSRRLRTSEPCLPVEQELAEEGRIVKYAETAGGENHFFFFLVTNISNNLLN